MASHSPGAQPRCAYHSDWGNYASLTECPNASATAVPAGIVTGVLEVGDTAYIVNSGPAHCTSVGTPGGLDAVWALTSVGTEYEGFQSDDLANYYQVPAASAGTCPGADDFIAIFLVASFAARSVFDDMIAQIGVAVSRGWRLTWNNGNLLSTVFVTGPVASQAITASAYNSNLAQGHMHAVAMRVYQSGGNTVSEIWLGPTMVATNTAAAGVIPADATDQLTLASGSVFGDERALNGGIYGMGYFEGTLTNDQMRSLLGRTLNERAIPAGALAWDNLWLGVDVAAAPVTWPAAVGAVDLERVGAPSGSTAYFPPV